MSGIKDEDFITSNYSPLFNITLGKWFLPSIGLQIGYKGFYFNYIADDVKHNYNYLYGEVLLNVNELIRSERMNKSWNIILHAGAGYFYNYIYKRSNFCTNVGLQTNFKISNEFYVVLDISAIIGWDIYQGDTDILPGISAGIIYNFDFLEFIK